jgi:copper(I)-binding protein
MMRLTRMRGAILGLALASVAGIAAAAGPIMVMKPEARASLGNVPTSAAYGMIHNMGGADRLVGAACACAAKVTMHSTVTTGGVARMIEDKAVDVPAGGMVTFSPGGRHLMLTGLKAPLRAGTKAPLTLRFEKAGAVEVVFDVVDAPGAAGHAGH